MQARPPTSFSPVPAALALTFGLALAACGRSSPEWPVVPTVASTSVPSQAFYPGAAVKVISTVESGSAAQNVPVGIFMKNASLPATCDGLTHLTLSHATLDAIAQAPKDAPPVRHVHQRMVSTIVEYASGTQNRRATLTRRFILPSVEPGAYRIATAVQPGQADCKFADGTVNVVRKFAPDLVHSSTALAQNSFRLPENIIAKRRVAGADLVVASEIVNSGLELTEPLEIGFELEVNGTRYPLDVQVEAASGGHTLSARHVIAANSAGITLPASGVRGTTYRLHLRDDAKAALRLLTADTATRLHVRIDPDAKVQEIKKSNNVATLPVMYLASSSTCTPATPASGQPYSTPPYYTVFCFGPHPPAYGIVGSPTEDILALDFQFGGSDLDPAYLYYALGQPYDPTGVPTSVRFHMETIIAVYMLYGLENIIPLDALIDIGYQMPPTLDSSGAMQFAEWNSKLVILNRVMFDHTSGVSIQSGADLDFLKVSEKWKLLESEVDIVDIPVHYEMGAEGEMGLSGSVTAQFDKLDFNASLGLSAGPYASLSAYGEASIDMLIASVGVGVDLNLIKISPRFEPSVRTFSARTSKDGQLQTNAGVEIGIDLPLVLSEGAGDFYAFLKILGAEHKSTIVAWKGATQSFDLISPLTMFRGPVGTFFVSANGGDTESGTIYQATPPPSGGTQWIGDISLEQGDYTFWMQNVDSIQLNTSAGKLVFTAGPACGPTTGSRQVNIPQKGTYALQAAVSTCGQASPTWPTKVWWTQNGQSGLVGMSGTSGFGTSTPTSGPITVAPGTPACNVQSWFFNAPFASSTPPALYQCSGTVDFDYPYDAAVKTQPPVNAPQAGLWLQYATSVPFGLDGNGLAVGIVGNIPYTDAACGAVVDDVSITISDGSFSTSIPVTLQADPPSPAVPVRGAAIVTVSQTAGVTGPLTLQASYHSRYPGDYPGKTCSTPFASPANDARLNLVAGPVGKWLVQTTCTQGAQLVNLLPGPSSASAGTLGAGSLFTENLCQQAGRVPAGESVVGVFTFVTAGNHDFFVGATASESYKVWIDGSLVASRTVTTPPTDCAAVTAGGPTYCFTRELHFVQNVSAGLHFIEAYFDDETGAAPVTNFSEHRIRWSPVATNQSLVSFYATPAELMAATTGATGPTGPTGPAPDGVAEPTMVLKYVEASPDSRTVGFNWASTPTPGAGGCADDPAVNGQFDCWNSLRLVKGTPGAVSFVWDGTYALADGTPYFYQATTGSIGTNTRQIDLWVDGQQYLDYQQGYWPFPDAAQVYGFVQSTVTGTTGNSLPAGVNRIRFRSIPLDTDAATASFTALWTPHAASSYAVVHLDADGNAIDVPYVTAYPSATGPQLGNATGGGGVPYNACRSFLIAPPQGDPAGTFASANGGVIDVLAALAPVPGFNQGRDLFDICLNGSCSTGNAGPGSSSTTSLASPQFVTYTYSADPSQLLGLFSQQYNNLLVHLYGSGAGGCYASPADAAYLLSLSYRTHSWNP